MLSEDPRELSLFQRFIETFNRGDYFHAHEVLEELWKETKGEKKLFYQGLIQASVALHHLEKGNRPGAEYEFARAKEKLLPYPALYGGIALESFLQLMEETFSTYQNKGKVIPVLISWSSE